MNDTSFLGLVQNIALLLAVAFIFDVAASRSRKGESSFLQAIAGLALGAIGITVMLTPWTFVPGIVFDTRSILIGISGLFFGSVSTVIAMAMTAAFRFYEGGAGAWTGVAVILTSGVIGAAWRYFRRRPLTEISWGELYLFGMVVHIAMLVVMLTLPWETSLRVLSSIALPVILIYPLGTALLGVFMVHRMQRDRTEWTLRESEERFRKIFEEAPLGIVITSPSFAFEKANPAFCRMMGYSADELCSMTFADITHPDHLKQDMENVKKVGRGEMPFYQTEKRYIDKSGKVLWGNLFVSSIHDEHGTLRYYLSMVNDITERKRVLESLRDAETRYRLLFEHSPDGIVIIDPATAKPLEFNENAYRQLGYSREEFANLSIPDIEAQETSEETRSRITRVTSEGRDDFDTRQHTKQGEIRDIHVTAQITEILGRPVYYCIWRDITDRKQSEEKLKDTLKSLRKAFGTTIQVMVSAVEAKDPYTSGHQLRSADLARAIATEMELPQEKIHGIRMAASIHDIGKLSIPAEILSKPTKLTNIEFSLIKEHSRKGYEMLKGVESPWPLAQIVYQHHERMNGSGYPSNLKGDEILMEARILAVADVVESMASHRPYRPAKGIEAALEEIVKNKGILYDDAVADACLRLFREKDFQLGRR